MTAPVRVISVMVLAIALPAAAFAGEEEGWRAAKARAKREKIDTKAKETLEELFAESPKAKALYGKSYGYAVFDNVKLSLMISAGGGVGVAVAKAGNKRTYMRMGTAGLNIGLGGQKYQIVFLFQDKGTFEQFIESGWQADASANAVAGRAGANAEASFTNGLAFFQLTQAGLMLQADIAGTKYWKNKKLNKN